MATKNIQLSNLTDNTELWYPITTMGNVSGLNVKISTIEDAASALAERVLDIESENLGAQLVTLESTHATDKAALEASIKKLGDDKLDASVYTSGVATLKSELEAYAEEKANGVKEALLGDDLEETFNTLKAVQEWANEHGDDYATLVADVNAKAAQSDLDTLTATVGTKADQSALNSAVANLEETIDDKVDSNVFDDYKAFVETLINGLKGRIETLEGMEHSNVKATVIIED